MFAFKLVNIVPREFYEEKLKEAYAIAEKFDPKGTPFIALALKLNIPVWTEDKDLVKNSFQTRKYVALDTIAVEEILLGKTTEEALQNLMKRLK